jgi:hypothetical protein
VLLLLVIAGGASADTGQRERGFAVSINIGTRLVALAGVGNVSGVNGGVFAGYKINRVIFGLGVDVARVANSQSVGNTTGTEADTAFLFVPGIQVAIVRSPDQRVELYGQFDLGLGTSVHEEDPAPGNAPDRNVFLLRYQLAPGVRFWVHPQFALNILTGVGGDFEFVTTSQGNTSVHESTGVTSIFASLGLMGVF